MASHCAFVAASSRSAPTNFMSRIRAIWLMRLIILLASAFNAAVAFAMTPSSANYALPASAINAGVATMTSPSYQLSSSVGDAVYTLRSTSTGAVATALSPGFWHATIGVTQGCVLDIDGNNAITALTDGLMLLRVMLGLSGAAVTNGATAFGAPRTTWAQIQPFIHLAALDIDGSGSTSPAGDGLMLLRAMFGLTGTAVTAGAVESARTWADIRLYLNTQCGGNFLL